MEEYKNEFKPRVGYAYVPPQELNEIYPIERGFEAGTIFPELDIPSNAYVPKTLNGGSM